MRLRVNPTLEVRGGANGEAEIVVSHPVRASCTVPVSIAGWLLGLGREHTRASLASTLATALGDSEDEAAAVVADLEAHGVLGAAFLPLPGGGPLSLHRASGEAVFETTDEAAENQGRLIAERAEGVKAGVDVPSPGPYAARDGRRVPLQLRWDGVCAARMTSALQGRQEKRNVTRETLEELLFHAAGATGEFPDFVGWGRHLAKTTPSLGARHAVEVYVLSGGMDDLPSGLYHYACGTHELVEVAQNGLVNFPFSAALLLTVRWPRMMWKYRDEASYFRMTMLEVGHMKATLELTANALGARFRDISMLASAQLAMRIGLPEDLDEGLLAMYGLGESHNVL